MRSHALYTAGICAILVATVTAAPAVKNARADTACGVTTVYVTVPPDLQSVGLTPGYNTLVSTLGASATSIADGISGQIVNSTGVIETVLTTSTVANIAISKADTTTVSYSSSSPTVDYIFPYSHGGSGSTLPVPAPVTLHPPMPSSDHVTSVQSGEGVNIGGKASNTDVYVVDQTLTVVPLSTVSASMTSTDQAITPTLKKALASTNPTESTDLLAAVTQGASGISSGFSMAQGLTDTPSSGSSAFGVWNTTASYGSNMVTGGSSLSSTTLYTYVSPSIICSECVDLPTDTFTGAAHSGFEMFPTSSTGSLVADSSSLQLTNSSISSQISVISSVSATTAPVTAANFSSSGTPTEGRATNSATSIMVPVATSANSTLPAARPRSDTLVQSLTDTSIYSSPTSYPASNGYTSNFGTAGLNLTASAITTPVANSEDDGITSSSVTTSDTTFTQFVTSVIATSTVTFTTSMTTSGGLAVSGNVFSSLSVSNGITLSNSGISSSPMSTGSAGTYSPSSVSAALVMSTTSMSLANSSQAQPTTCTESYDFTLNFDDLPPQAAFDNATAQPMPLFSPYHKMWFSGGFTIVPPPTDPYMPSSGRLLVEFLSTILSDLGTTGAIGNGRNELSGCFNFNALGMSVGCDSEGPDCDWYFSGYQYDLTSDTYNQITSQNISTPACPALTNCSLIPITLDYSFQNMTEVRIHLTVAGEDKIWWMDDLKLEWFDKCCDAQLCRSNVR